MYARRILLSLGLIIQTGACSDSATPAGFEPMNGAQLAMLGESLSAPAEASTLHILKQSANAPTLDSYQLSFWAYKGRASSVRVKYKALTATAAGGQAFLQFDIPKDGLASGANGAKLRMGDSVQITLSIDPNLFKVDFQPSGVQFSSRSPATLDMWFNNADPDLNGDGVVDSSDDAVKQQLSIWTTQDYSSWTKLASVLNLSTSDVRTAVYHFSGYSVSW